MTYRYQVILYTNTYEHNRSNTTDTHWMDSTVLSADTKRAAVYIVKAMKPNRAEIVDGYTGTVVRLIQDWGRMVEDVSSTGSVYHNIEYTDGSTSNERERWSSLL